MSRRFPRRTQAALALVALLGILPTAVHGLPSRSEQHSPVVRSHAGSWLSLLGDVARTLWTKATGENGIIIDPDGKPTALPGDDGPDTGRSAG